MHQDESGILNIIVTLNCHNNRQKVSELVRLIPSYNLMFPYFLIYI